MLEDGNRGSQQKAREVHSWLTADPGYALKVGWLAGGPSRVVTVAWGCVPGVSRKEGLQDCFTAPQENNTPDPGKAVFTIR